MLDIIADNFLMFLGITGVILAVVLITILLVVRSSRRKEQKPQIEQNLPQNKVGSSATENNHLTRAKAQEKNGLSEMDGSREFGLQLVLDDDQIFQLTLPASIGRHQSNSIVIEDDSVSEKHARIYYDQRIGAVCIEDLNSLNGIFIDGRPTIKNLLENDARLTLGGVSFTFRNTGYLPPSN